MLNCSFQNSALSGRAFSASPSYLELPNASTFRGGTPIRKALSISSSECMAICVNCSKTGRKRGAKYLNKRSEDREMRPLSSSAGIFLPFSSRKKLGQNSVSKSIKRSGWMVLIARDTHLEKSRGKGKTAIPGGSSARANLRP